LKAAAKKNKPATMLKIAFILCLFFGRGDVIFLLSGVSKAIPYDRLPNGWRYPLVGETR
jgi:hypothetical protein